MNNNTPKTSDSRYFLFSKKRAQVEPMPASGPRTIQVAIIGDRRVGKTSIIEKLHGQRYPASPHSYPPAPAPKLLKTVASDEALFLETWEYPQDKPTREDNQYSAEAGYLVVVLDATTFESLQFARGYFKNRPINPNQKVIVVVNKTDMPDSDRIIDRAMVEKLVGFLREKGITVAGSIGIPVIGPSSEKIALLKKALVSPEIIDPKKAAQLKMAAHAATVT